MPWNGVESFKTDYQIETYDTENETTTLQKCEPKTCTNGQPASLQNKYCENLEAPSCSGTQPANTKSNPHAANPTTPNVEIKLVQPGSKEACSYICEE